MKKQHFACVVAAALLMGAGLTSCVEEIDTSNRYTFMGETVGSYLESHNETYSKFNYILQRSGQINLLKAYGSYTCFAPINEAVDRYLFEQDSIYEESLKPGSKKVIWTGITSPVLEELSDSMCDVIAKTHIIAKGLLTTDMEGDVVPSMNLNHRFLTMSFDVDENLHSVIFINGARMILADEEVENGVVHMMGGVLNPSTNTVPSQIRDIPFLSIFSEALEVTALEDKLQDYRDDSYDGEGKVCSVAHCGGALPYPPTRYYGFTAFCEPDEVFNNMGIFTIADLYKQCKIWYPEATDPDYKSPNNALYKFMAYHLVDYHLLYTRLVYYNLTGVTNGTQFNSELKFLRATDRVEYYETFQGTLIKIIMPRSSDIEAEDTDGTRRQFRNTVFLNYAKTAVNLSDPFNSTLGPTKVPVNVRIMDPVEVSNQPERYPEFIQECLNGTIHLIDHPLVYDEDVMVGHVLNGIIRIDLSALLPELTNNHLRWADGSIPCPDASDAGFYLPEGYCDRVKVYSDECHLSYLLPRNGWDELYGDLLCCRGPFDFAYRLPHVPKGTYEIRISCINEPGRGIIQYYVDNEICGIPVNHNIYSDSPAIGSVPDNQTDDNGVNNDKVMKNHGYLKLPNSYYRQNAGGVARTYTHGIRYVVTTKYLSGDYHWLRIKNVNENDGGSDYNHNDYIELVPVSWLRREDLSLEEKRW